MHAMFHEKHQVTTKTSLKFFEKKKREIHKNKINFFLSQQFRLESEWICHQKVIKTLFGLNKTTLSLTNVITEKIML